MSFASLLFFLLSVFATQQHLAAAAIGVCGSLSNNTEYDFIIIGGGTAGLALATRLSQGLPKDRILVLEAGPDGRNESRIYIPGRKGSTLGTSYDWNFTTIPQPHALNRSIAQNRGKVLGGSSALNLMDWDRASIADYDSWAELGNPGWDWQSMLPAMLKAENFTRNESTYDGAGVATGGPIQALVNDFVPTQQFSFIPTLETFNISHNLASLDGNPVGVAWQPSNVRKSDYTRSYSPTYLTLANENLSVMTDSQVARMNMQKGANGTLAATGVTLLDNTIYAARKEVILSAGSFQSPNVLELSGIGSSSYLQSAGIEPLLDLPGVGENLQDHIRIQNSYQLKPEYNGFDQLRWNTTFAAQERAKWEAGQRSMYDYTGSGLSFETWDQVAGAPVDNLTNLARQAAAADNSSRVTQRKLEYLTDPQLQIQVPQLEVIFSDGYNGVKGYPAVNSSLYGKNFFTLITGVQHPMSRGSVHVNGSDPLGKPIINPNYLKQEYDFQAAVAAFKFNRLIASTPPMSDIWVSEYEPGVDVDTEEEVELFVKNNTLTIYHPVGSCSMMPREDGGVVDPNLKVYGTSNVRVVDASIMPIIISAHLQTAVYGIAERAAEFIINAWQD